MTRQTKRGFELCCDLKIVSHILKDIIFGIVIKEMRVNFQVDNFNKLFDTLMVLKKSCIQGVKFGTIINCEGIIKAILENPKADQNTLFR